MTASTIWFFLGYYWGEFWNVLEIVLRILDDWQVELFWAIALDRDSICMMPGNTQQTCRRCRPVPLAVPSGLVVPSGWDLPQSREPRAGAVPRFGPAGVWWEHFDPRPKTASSTDLYFASQASRKGGEEELRTDPLVWKLQVVASFCRVDVRRR